MPARCSKIRAQKKEVKNEPANLIARQALSIEYL